MQALEDQVDDYESIGAIDYFPSTVGILANSNLFQWSTYFPLSPMPVSGINDFRIIPVTNEIVARVKGEFVWTGNSAMNENEILISERLVYHVLRTHDIQLEPGMVLDFDILRNMPIARGGNPILGYAWNTDPLRMENYTIAGIYKLKSLSTLFSQALPSILRPDPWPEHIEDKESVLGLEDSVMILRNQLSVDDLNQISRDGYFEPVTLFRGDVSVLVDKGARNIEDNILQVKTLVEDSYPRVTIKGATTLSDISDMILTFEKGQMLTLVALPIIFLSLFVTIFTSESTLTHRKLEITVLRAKGASYNQIVSSILWESMILTALGLVIGFLLTATLTPLIGSSTGLLTLNFFEFLRYSSALRIPLFSVILAFIIGLFLPGLYLYQVERRINVFEIGKPIEEEEQEEIKESNSYLFFLVFIVLIICTLFLPYILSLIQISRIYGLLSLIGILLVISFVGSRVIQQGLSTIFSRFSCKLGSFSMYVYQSLRRRRGKFIPLMIILTLSLTISTMMLVQSSSYTDTIRNDVLYSFGCDLRGEMTHPYPYSVVLDLETKEKVNFVTPVTRHSVSHEKDRMTMIGVDAYSYSRIGTFTSETFHGNDPNEVLQDLANLENGVIISSYYADLHSLKVGDPFDVRVLTVSGIDLTVVGIMDSAPGFGLAHNDGSEETITSSLGFRTNQKEFILVNYQMVSLELGLFETDLYLMNVEVDADFPSLYDEILSEYDIDLKTPHWNLLPEKEKIIEGDDSIFYSTQPPIYKEIDRYTRGVQGISTVCIFSTLTLAISSIGLFFGSALWERRSEYAIVRAVGGKRKDVFTMVINEFIGLVITTLLISTALGLIFGMVTTSLIMDLSPFKPILSETISLHFIDSLLVFGFEIAALLISCYYPARKASEQNIIGVLRNL